MGAIVTIPILIGIIYLLPKKLNKNPSVLSKQKTPKLQGNPKQNGTAIGVSKTVTCGYKFKHHEDWVYYFRNEAKKLIINQIK